MGCSSSTPKAEEGGALPAVNSRRRLSTTGAEATEKARATEIAKKQNQKRRRLSVMEGGGLATAAAAAAGGASADRKGAFGSAQVVNCKDTTAKHLPLTYACFSRPGNDPMKNEKENQDSMTVIDQYVTKDQMFIAVFDGHGPNGAHASQFIRDILPQRVACPMLEMQPFVALSNGCIHSNRELSASEWDVKVSGSTGIISFLRGNKLFVANVGDSRAVLGRMNDKGRIRAVDLSHDHKPDRPDEKARIIAQGGRVFEWGVPRVWLRDADMPGLAMARSFGDEAAESVGVFAEPELSKVTLTHNHRFVIWASDGVWEFISSQEACDIVYSHYREGPRKAANALVAESVRRWNLEEDVVDDTTVVLLFLNYPKGYKRASSSAADESKDGDA